MRAFDAEADLFQLASKFARRARSGIQEEQILHHGKAKVAAAEALGQFGGGQELIAGEASAQHAGADVAEPGLLLRMNADVVAQNVVGDGFLDARDRICNRCGFEFRRGTVPRSSPPS